MADAIRPPVAERYKELKRVLAEYTALHEDLPLKPARGQDLGGPFERCVLEAHLVFPGLTPDEREELALVRLASMNILARYLMSQVSSDELARCGLQIMDKKELDRITDELEADFVRCKNHILSKGIVSRMTEVQKLFWEEWSDPFQSLPKT